MSHLDLQKVLILFYCTIFLADENTDLTQLTLEAIEGRDAEELPVVEGEEVYEEPPALEEASTTAARSKAEELDDEEELVEDNHDDEARLVPASSDKQVAQRKFMLSFQCSLTGVQWTAHSKTSAF